jgi:branched-chain amino acid transport system ATP-binding protein
MSQGDTHETSQLISQLGQSVTILLIEHDVELVMDLSKHVIVMAQGEKIAQGSPQEVRSNPVVQTAYFGDAV